MDKSKKGKMTRRKIAGIILAAVTILFIIYCLLFLTQSQNEKIEKGVVKVMETYSDNFNDQEVKALSKELSTLVEEKLRQISGDDLTKEQLKELLELITKEINNKFENLTEKEVHLIANSVLKEMIDQGMGYTSEDKEKLETYKKQIDELTIEIDHELENMIKEFEKEISRVETIISGQTKELEKEVSKLTEEFNGLEKSEKENSKLVERIADLEKLEKEVSKLTENLVDLEKLKKEVSKFTENLTNLETKVSELEKDNEAAEKDKNELDTKLKEIIEKAKEQEKELEVLNERMKDMEDGVLYYRYEEETDTLHVHGKSE